MSFHPLSRDKILSNPRAESDYSVFCHSTPSPVAKFFLIRAEGRITAVFVIPHPTTCQKASKSDASVRLQQFLSLHTLHPPPLHTLRNRHCKTSKFRRNSEVPDISHANLLRKACLKVLASLDMQHPPLRPLLSYVKIKPIKQLEQQRTQRRYNKHGETNN